MNRNLLFGRVEFRSSQREVLVDGRQVAMGQRAFDVLQTLVERRDRVVTKDELFESVWPGRVVGEHNIWVQVSTLRKLLGPEIIITIPGRGYRFMWQADESPPMSREPATLTKLALETNLPSSLMPLVGRDADAARLDALLDTHRLVTITGAGGVGKSRLAQRALHERRQTYPHGVAWVELAGLSDPTLLAGAIGQAAGLQMGAGDPLQALVLSLRHLNMALALDNAEYLVDEVARVAQALFDGAPDVRVLVTSQVPLKLRHEQAFSLAPLAVPTQPLAPAQAMEFAAVELFVQRAQAVERDFKLDEHNVEAVIDICRQLDGLPLAIELAAARASLLGMKILATSLDARLQLLSSGQRFAPPRQQTLRAALEWSHGLLSAQEQCVLRRLGVFVGGFSIELAQRVVGEPEAGLSDWKVLDVLSALIDRSLVVAEPGEPPRLRLLESTRVFALERLAAAAEVNQIKRRHAHVILARFDQLQDARMTGRWRTDEVSKAIRKDLDNGREALAWSLCHATDLAVALVPHLSNVMYDTSRLEALVLWNSTESFIGEQLPLKLRATWALGLSRYWGTRNVDLAVRWGLAAAKAYRELGDAVGLYRALCAVCMSHGSQAGELQRRCLAELLLLESSDWPASIRNDGALAAALIARIDKNYTFAIAAYQRGLIFAEAAGDSRRALHALLSMTDIELMTGETAAAVHHGEEVVARLRAERIPLLMAIALLNLTGALLFADQTARAREMAEEGWPLGLHFLLQGPWSDYLAMLAAREGRNADASRLLGYSDVLSADDPRQPNEERAAKEAERAARAGLGDVEFERLRESGRLLRDGDVDSLAFR